jgi:cytosine/adenosine deaminase-related metal-dependent hydrolase
VSETAALDLSGLTLLPGLINAHDHLDFALFPRLGTGPWKSATEWARDIHRPNEDPVRRHLLVPKKARLFWGGLRNLLAGVTTVSHHDPYNPSFDEDFPVRVVHNYGWAHSFAFTEDVRAAFEATPHDAPFLIHLAEGTDDASAAEIGRLRDAGALSKTTVIVHGVGLTEAGWDEVRAAAASAISCPRSNLFVLGKTLDLPRIASMVPTALATDSPLTAEGDLLDEIRFAKDHFRLDHAILLGMVTRKAAQILHLPERTGDWIAARAFGEPPELVVSENKIRLISEPLAGALPKELRAEFSRLCMEGRPTVLVRWKLEPLFEETLAVLGDEVRLGGRLIGLGQ